MESYDQISALKAHSLELRLDGNGAKVEVRPGRGLLR